MERPTDFMPVIIKLEAKRRRQEEAVKDTERILLSFRLLQMQQNNTVNGLTEAERREMEGAEFAKPPLHDRAAK